jgi:prolipoprotein diacylglyceryltransferase
MEFSLLGAAAMGAFAFWLMLRWEAKRGNAAGCAVDLWDAGLISAISGLFIGRVVAMLQAGISPITDPAQIILIRSGVSTAATAAATLAVFAFISRRSLLRAADGVAPSALAGLAGWHAGCITSAACLGTESSLPWAYALEGSSITRHPVELYTAAALLIPAVGIALWKQHGKPPLGAPAGLGMMAAAGIRLVTEPMRISLEGGPVSLYVIGVVAGFGLFVFSVVRLRYSATS